MTVQARRGCGQTRMAGAYTDQRLNLSKLWEGPRKKCQGFKPDPGNPAVRDYRGASGNVAMVEMCTRLAIERARTVTLHLQLARRSSIPTKHIGTPAVHMLFEPAHKCFEAVSKRSTRAHMGPNRTAHLRQTPDPSRAVLIGNGTVCRGTTSRPLGFASVAPDVLGL